MCHRLAIDISFRINILLDESLNYTQESFILPTGTSTLTSTVEVKPTLNMFKMPNKIEWIDTKHLKIVFNEAFFDT